MGEASPGGLLPAHTLDDIDELMDVLADVHEPDAEPDRYLANPAERVPSRDCPTPCPRRDGLLVVRRRGEVDQGEQEQTQVYWWLVMAILVVSPHRGQQDVTRVQRARPRLLVLADRLSA
ncbi:hypothetical protein GTY65_40090 [Streptomyces sp. SID8379]|uniref:hypothetical protein n=1 Tax=unclassified Streptomyces TaxID=2593676 RepID=UPI000371BB32|nr:MULTISPECIES: hypothetical protein [unclassified Streptomyces]MYW70208.1 hypothetical protein [Streptomyces sp. SID8379]